MAEGWARKLSDNIRPWSAGVEKHGLNPYAVKVMKEVGIDISTHYSKLTEEIKEQNFDYVITVCDSAKEKCPYYSGNTTVIHRSFADPPVLSKNAKSDFEILQIYRAVRDEIKKFIQGMPENLN
jgi:arsenate reductase